MEFHNGCTLVHLRVRKWGGEAKALDSDYKADGELPPANLLKRGQKAVFPPSALTAFDTLRRKAERVLLSKGTRFAGGFLVANEGLEDVLELLKQIEGEFDQAKTKFLSEFDMNLENWLAANAEHQRVIRQILDKDYIGAKFGFGYDLLEISPKPGHEFDEEAISSSVLHEVGVLCNTAADSLCAELHAKGAQVVALQSDAADPAAAEAVVAECIEDDAQLQILREMGCDFGQGYLFSRPVDRNATLAHLQQVCTGVRT